MAETFDLLIKGATLVNHAGEGLADIGVKDGRIVALGNLKVNAAGHTIDATGLHVLPGVIDTQVHFREPGLEHKEDLETGSRSAVLGGITAVFEMPNTKPTTVTAEALAHKVARGRGRMYCDFAFFVGATFLPTVLFDSVCFFLVLILVAMFAVYHRLVIPSA